VRATWKVTVTATGTPSSGNLRPGCEHAWTRVGAGAWYVQDWWPGARTILARPRARWPTSTSGGGSKTPVHGVISRSRVRLGVRPEAIFHLRSPCYTVAVVSECAPTHVRSPSAQWNKRCGSSEQGTGCSAPAPAAPAPATGASGTGASATGACARRRPPYDSRAGAASP